MDGDDPRKLDNGTPDFRFFYFPADKTEVVKTWDTGGLRGTASHDLLLREAIVGSDFGFAMGAKPWPAAPMYAAGSKVWSQTAFAVVTLGIAKAAIDALTKIAKKRVATKASAPLKDKPVLRDELGRADAALRAAESFFEKEVAHCSDKLNALETLSESESAILSQSCSHLADTSRQVVQTMYRLGGGASVYRSCPLDRCLRDVQVAAQHASIGPKHYDTAARAMLEMPIG
jgi:alkylation response protein AidB-like acyl-CoA dehydrogenase